MSVKSRLRVAEQYSDDCLADYKYVFREDLLKDQVAFITGGGSGIGFRIAEILMRHGCHTAIASRRMERVSAAAKKLERATGRKCLPLRADVRRPSEIETAIDEILCAFGKVTILVNNAAGNFVCDIASLSYNAYKTVLDIDAIGSFNVSKAVYQKCFKGNGGNIVNISATLYYRGRGLQTHAGTAKAAVDAMTKHLAVEWGPDSVRVNSVAPGPIRGTEGIRRLSKISSTRGVNTPPIRMGEKYEIAEAVLFLASDASSYVNGAILVVDGGAWLTSDRVNMIANKTRSKM